MTGKTVFMWDDKFLGYDLGPTHPLRPIRVGLTHALVRAKGMLDGSKAQAASPRVASKKELMLFHTDEYLRLVKRVSEKGSGLLDAGDTPGFKGCYEMTSLVVGASLEACDLVMKGKFDHGFNPSGGLHHAHPDRASGFCIFNDPAVTIAYLEKEWNVKRILYLDIDAHHGDGVMYGFYEDPAVLDIDFHENGRYIFPGTGFPDETGRGLGKGLKVNIPLSPGTGDEAFLQGFESIVPSLVRKHRPEIILVQCGADGHDKDLLAHLRLTTKMYEEVVSTMHSLAHEHCNGRFLLFGGGGYTLANVPRVWTLAFAALAGCELDNEIPASWREEYNRLTGEQAPRKLRDDLLKNDPAKSLEEVESVLMMLDKEIGWKPSGV